MTSVEQTIQGVLARVRVNDRADEENERHRRVMRQAEAQRLLDRLPLILRHAKRAELEGRVNDQRLLVAVRAWHWGAGNLLLLGDSDSGKSVAAGILYRSLLARAVVSGGNDWDRVQSMYWFGAERLDGARRTHGAGRGDAPEIIDACNARLLFLDDAGWDESPRAVSEVLDVRYDRGWPTVITSGKTAVELYKHYGDAVARRMVDAGGKRSTIVDCFK